MLQLPPAPTTTLPITVVPSGAYKVMVSPGVPVPLIAGLALLVIESVLKLPVSFAALCVRLATGAAGTTAFTTIGSEGLCVLSLPARSVNV